jgi:putative acetyltransferase
MLIRRGTPQDVDAILAIWLDASVTAHSFIDPDYWMSKVDSMRTLYLAASATYIAQKDNEIVGFLMIDQDTVSALFIHPKQQGLGHGSQLLAHVKSAHAQLCLCVYKKNIASIKFYQRQGFIITAEQIEVATGQAQCVMCWGG